MLLPHGAGTLETLLEVEDDAGSRRTMNADTVTLKQPTADVWHETSPDLYRSEAFAEDLLDEHSPKPRRRAADQQRHPRAASAGWRQMFGAGWLRPSSR